MTTLRAEVPVAIVQSVTISAEALTAELSDGRAISVPLAWYPRLLHGSPEERQNWRLIGAGEGVHWPDLDEDISAENLVLGKPSGESQVSLKRWLNQRQLDKSSEFALRVPAHASEPPVLRDDPSVQHLLSVALHGHKEERQLVQGIKRLVAKSEQVVEIQEVLLRDAGLYIVLNVGIGIAANLITDLIRYLSAKSKRRRAPKRTPVIYIAPVYAPKSVFRLPEQQEEVLEYFRRYPSKTDTDN